MHILPKRRPEEQAEAVGQLIRVDDASGILMYEAYHLLGDGAGDEWDDNTEYTRAIVELVSAVHGWTKDQYDECLAAIRAVGEDPDIVRYLTEVYPRTEEEA